MSWLDAVDASINVMENQCYVAFGLVLGDSKKIYYHDSCSENIAIVDTITIVLYG